jgi:hypothetical protein
MTTWRMTGVGEADLSSYKGLRWAQGGGGDLVRCPALYSFGHHVPFDNNAIYSISFSARSHSREKSLVASSCLSVRMHKLGATGRDFHGILLTFVEEIRIWRKQYIGHVTRRRKYVHIVGREVIRHLHRSPRATRLFWRPRAYNWYGILFEIL